MWLDEIGRAGFGRRFHRRADVVRRSESGVNQPPPDNAFRRRKLECQCLPIGIDHEVNHSALQPPHCEGKAVRLVAQIRLIKFDAVNLNLSLT